MTWLSSLNENNENVEENEVKMRAVFFRHLTSRSYGWCGCKLFFEQDTFFKLPDGKSFGNNTKGRKLLCFWFSHERNVISVNIKLSAISANLFL